MEKSDLLFAVGEHQWLLMERAVGLVSCSAWLEGMSVSKSSLRQVPGDTKAPALFRNDEIWRGNGFNTEGS